MYLRSEVKNSSTSRRAFLIVDRAGNERKHFHVSQKTQEELGLESIHTWELRTKGMRWESSVVAAAKAAYVSTNSLRGTLIVLCRAVDRANEQMLIGGNAPDQCPCTEDDRHRYPPICRMRQHYLVPRMRHYSYALPVCTSCVQKAEGEEPYNLQLAMRAWRALIANELPAIGIAVDPMAQELEVKV